MYFKGDYVMTSIMFISVDFIARDVFPLLGGFSRTFPLEYEFNLVIIIIWWRFLMILQKNDFQQNDKQKLQMMK